MTSTPKDKQTLIEAFRAAAYRQVDKWVDQQTEIFAAETLPTLRQMSDQFMRTRSTLLGGCLEEMVKELTASYLQQEQALCPHCEKSLKLHSINPKTLHTLQGSITLQRPYFYCRDCKQGVYPLDEALELADEAYQYDMQEKMLRMGMESPYAISAELFKELTGISPSNHCLHDTLNRIGAVAPIEEVIPTTEEIACRIESAKSADDERPVLVVASDGAHAPTAARVGATGPVAQASGGKPRASASIFWKARTTSSRLPVGIRSRTRLNSPRIWRSSPHASRRTRSASPSWAMAPSGYGPP
jgi:hypothetical protein